MSISTEFLFNIQMDCEATQHDVNDPALGERAVRGMAEVLTATAMKATFVVIPSDMKIHANIYRELEAEGHEVGLHLHSADQGYEEFLGVYDFEMQMKILREAIDVFAQHMGRMPHCFTPGYYSANDYTFPALEALHLTHGTVSLPTRDLPQCACVWGSSPLGAHYPHRYNRCLAGDVDFVDVPPTVDVDSRLWGGAHPQDLRVELVDAKNHWYTIHKNVKRQLAAGDTLAVKYLKASTHNVFDYLDQNNFRRHTLLGIIRAARSICDEEGCVLVPATTAEIAIRYRQCVPLPRAGIKLVLDVRGRSAWTGSTSRAQ